MEDGSKAWDVYDTLEVDENGIPITTTTTINEEHAEDREPYQQGTMLHRNETIDEISDNPTVSYEQVDRLNTSSSQRKLHLPDEVIGIIKNGVKSTISFNISVEIDMIPESIIDFLSQSYNIPKEDVVKDIVELAFDEGDAKEILSRGIIKELWKQ